MPQPRTATDFKWKAQDVLMLMLHGYSEVFFKSYSTQKTISSFSWHCPGKYCLCQPSEEVVHRSAQLNRTTTNPCHPHTAALGTGSVEQDQSWDVFPTQPLVWYKQPQQPLLREKEMKFPALTVMICDWRKIVTVQWRVESTETNCFSQYFLTKIFIDRTSRETNKKTVKLCWSTRSGVILTVIRPQTLKTRAASPKAMLSASHTLLL